MPYPQPGSVYPPAGQPAHPQNGFGLTGFILGVLAVLLAWIPLVGIIGWPLSILGLVFALIGLNKLRHHHADNRGLTVAGLVLSSIGLIICIIWAAAVGTAVSQATPAVSGHPVVSAAAPDAAAAAPAAKPATTTAQDNAVAKAESYLSLKGFSRAGLIHQLQFEGFSTADATYAVDHVTVDWTEQADKAAKSYLDIMAFSRSGLINQLKFDGFTTAEAQHGATSVGL